jgi:chromosomal replication initiator protein
VRSSVRELEGSIIRLLAYASLRKREITPELAREALRDKLQPSESGEEPAVALTVQIIQQMVAKEWGIPTEGLRAKGRTKNLTIPRQVAMHLIRDLLGMQLVEIGNAFGGRDHSTVIHSLEKTENSLRDDAVFRERVLRVRGVLEKLRR